MLDGIGVAAYGLVRREARQPGHERTRLSGAPLAAPCQEMVGVSAAVNFSLWLPYDCQTFRYCKLTS